MTEHLFEKIDYISKFKDKLDPVEAQTKIIPWVDEGIELNHEMAGLIKKDLINTLLILDIVQWTLGKLFKKLLKSI